MTNVELVTAWVPAITLLLAVVSTFIGPLGTMLAERTHNLRIERIANAAGRYAAAVSLKLGDLPPGADLNHMRAIFLDTATRTLAAEFAGSAAKLGLTDSKMDEIVKGEFGKLPPRASVVVDGLAVPAAVVATAPTVAGPSVLPPSPQPASHMTMPGAIGPESLADLTG